MNHYAIDQWVDFSRGLVTGEDGARMRAHLATGCSECDHLSEFTSKLAQACSNSAASQVPESALRMARAIFPLRVPDRPERGAALLGKNMNGSQARSVFSRSSVPLGSQGLGAGELNACQAVYTGLKDRKGGD